MGCWASLWEVHDKDSNGNVTKGDVILQDSRNCMIHGNGKLVSVIGLDNIVVVETKDAMMIVHKDKVQGVKQMVNTLNEQGRSETQNHLEVYRPWGSYDSVDMGGRFQVKRISVKPGASLSLQMQHHRAEHWIVVSGTAQVTCDGHQNPDPRALIEASLHTSRFKEQSPPTTFCVFPSAEGCWGFFIA